MFGSHRATAFAAREHSQSAVTFALCAARGKLSKSDRYAPGRAAPPAGRPRARRLFWRDLDELRNGRLHPHQGRVSLVHSTQVDLWVPWPRRQLGVGPMPAKEDAQTAFPVERVAHPQGGQTVLGYHDQLAIRFQEPDWHPALPARATPDRLDDDCVCTRVGRTGQAQAKRPHAQWVSKLSRRSLKPGLLGARHPSYANPARPSLTPCNPQLGKLTKGGRYAQAWLDG